ncbi:zinc ribbon domain-containing protein [Filobacillus milosensis]|uniref:Zinc ribbon domain-containing protein n=1 Tax=Filobacillus milosensis TaxID=94137 RepID=A0A4Y8IGD2_9BACI|nr:zinc ribbon domain-containing protein [Filobacillus milosensis]TFB14217.1 zinc ribbon domain-containing protein [Filobacillus milosensis]
MKTCKNCNHQQDSGNFCENCGHPLNEDLHNAQTEGAATKGAQTQNSQLDNIKYHTKNYFNYFLSLLKNPNSSLKQPESSFVNGIITLLILSITLAIGFYLLVNGVYNQTIVQFGGFVETQSLPFFSIFFRIIFSALLIILAGLAGLLTVVEIAKVDVSFKTLLSQYGAFSVPFTVVTALTIFTGIATSTQLTMILFFLGIVAFVTLAPVIISFYHLRKFNENGHVVYLSICSFVITNTIIYIMFKIYLGSVLQNFDQFM